MLDKRLRKSGYKFHSFGDAVVCLKQAGRLLVALSGSASLMPSWNVRLSELSEDRANRQHSFAHLLRKRSQYHLIICVAP
jgi:hypothetical protein